MLSSGVFHELDDGMFVVKNEWPSYVSDIPSFRVLPERIVGDGKGEYEDCDEVAHHEPGGPGPWVESF